MAPKSTRLWVGLRPKRLTANRTELILQCIFSHIPPPILVSSPSPLLLFVSQENAAFSPPTYIPVLRKSKLIFIGSRPRVRPRFNAEFYSSLRPPDANLSRYSYPMANCISQVSTFVFIPHLGHGWPKFESCGCDILTSVPSSLSDRRDKKLYFFPSLCQTRQPPRATNALTLSFGPDVSGVRRGQGE